jgi:hypothetical protein
MSLTIHNVQQRTPEWYAARCGLVTASVMNTLVTVGSPDASAVACPSCEAETESPCLAKGRKEPTEIKKFHDERAAAAADLPPVYMPADNDASKALILALAAERVTDFVEDTFTTYDMARGIDAEPYARDLYAEHTAQPVDQCGFMVREFDGFKIGYSPDGLVGDDGLIEIKAPRQKGHFSTVVNEEEIPARHMAQLQTGLLVSGRQWIDFVSHCGGMHLWPVRVTPDPAWQAAILAAAEKAEKAIADHVATYQRATDGLPLAKRIDFTTVELRGIA